MSEEPISARRLPAPVAEHLELPPRPTVRGALRVGIEGFFYNSWKLVPANVVWGIVLLATVALALVGSVVALALFLIVLPLPTAGLFRLAALIQRGEPTTFSDAFAWRGIWKRALGTGLVVGGASVVLLFDVLIGVSSSEPMSWAMATAAAWGVLIIWLVAAALWPLLLDPQRASEPVTRLVRLAATVILVRPAPFLVLAAILAVWLIATTILFAALITIAVAYLALVLSAYVIPTADRIEGRRTFVVTD